MNNLKPINILPYIAGQSTLLFNILIFCAM